MGVMDLFRTSSEKKRRELSRVQSSMAGLPAQAGIERRPSSATAPSERSPRTGARAGAATDEPAARPIRRSGAANEEAPSVPRSVVGGGSVIVRAPSGLVVGHPWEPLRPEALLPLLSTEGGALLAAQGDDSDGRLFVDESGALLRYLQPNGAREDRLRYELDDRFFTTLVVRAWPREGASPALWEPFFMELPRRVPEIDISLHYWRIGATAAAKELKLQIDKRQLELDTLIEEVGHDDIRVVKLEEQINAMRENLQGLIRQQETLFHVSCYLRVGADSPEELRERVKEVEEVARGANLALMTGPGEQRDSYVSSMPFAADPAYYTHLRSSAVAAELLPLISRAHIERNRRGKNPVVLYGLHMANYTPVLMSPWNSDETVSLTTILGKTGSGKSYWLRCHLGRLAMVGVQTITIDPLGDFVRWHQQNEGTIIEIAPNSDYHVNPFKRSYSEADDAEDGLEPLHEKIIRLLPMFQLILGTEYDVLAKSLIEGGLRHFYELYGTEEKLMRDFILTLREYNQSSVGAFDPETIKARGRLIDILANRCLDGALKSFFEFPTNIALDLRDPRNRRILFNLKPSGEGELMIFASYMAMTMAAQIAQSTNDRKILLIDELHQLFKASNMASGIGDILVALVRIHRHWNCLGGETLVRTTDGLRPIRELAGAIPTLLTEGGRWVEAPVRNFGPQALWRLHFRRGEARRMVRATAEHRWILEGDRESSVEGVPSKRTRLTTAELKSGDRLASAWANDDEMVPGAWEVEQVERSGEVEDVFCATVPVLESFALADGLLTANCALTFATQYVDEDQTNAAQEGVLTSATTWILLRATEKMLEQSARLIGKDADLELLTDTLKISPATAEELRREPKPMVVYRAGEPVPMLSVGLSFEDAEDDKSSGVRGVTRSGGLDEPT